MKYYFLNYLNLGKKDTLIKIKVKEEHTFKRIKKVNIEEFKNWKYQNIEINGKRLKNIDYIYNRAIKTGSIKVGKKIYKIKNFVLINPTSLVNDVNKTKSNWENWWKKIRKKSDVDLYDKLWVKAEQKLDGEPLYIKKDFKNKMVLDAGCGSGRYLPLFEEFGAKDIVAVDLGKQIFMVHEQDVDLTKVHLIQSDLTNLPFAKDIFDTITSHGVLHHTPNPLKSFKALSNFLKVGGTQAIYVYHKEWWHFSAHKKSHFIDLAYQIGISIWQGIRKIISRLPHTLIVWFCYALAVKGTFEQSLMKSENSFIKTLGKIFFSIPPICYLGVNFHERIVRNYDHYSATYNYFQTIDEVVDWFRKSGFNDIEIASIPVSIRGKKEANPTSPLRIKQYKFLSHFEFREMWDKLYLKKR